MSGPQLRHLETLCICQVHPACHQVAPGSLEPHLLKPMRAGLVAPGDSQNHGSLKFSIPPGSDASFADPIAITIESLYFCRFCSALKSSCIEEEDTFSSLGIL